MAPPPLASGRISQRRRWKGMGLVYSRPPLLCCDDEAGAAAAEVTDDDAGLAPGVGAAPPTAKPTLPPLWPGRLGKEEWSGRCW